MRVSCIQMDVAFAAPEENFPRAAELIRAAAKEGADVIVLPELWNVGFFPREELPCLSDPHCQRTKAEIGGLAKELGVNIVAGSVACLREDGVYNTACVFDRAGDLVAVYDKTHLFTHMGEQACFAPGDHISRFSLDGVRCGIVICYDVRFPELIRSMSVKGLELLFVVSQWPAVRIPHLRCLTAARAIENQAFVACCNGCGTAGETRFGGVSAIIDPWGETIALAGAGEEILSACCDLSVVEEIRRSIPVFADRRPELYNI